MIVSISHFVCETLNMPNTRQYNFFQLFFYVVIEKFKYTLKVEKKSNNKLVSFNIVLQHKSASMTKKIIKRSNLSGSESY